MKRKLRVLFLSTYPPRACGIGTFAGDLTASLKQNTPWIAPRIAAIDLDDGERLEYGGEVVCRVTNDQRRAYTDLAQIVNGSDYDVVCVQHEFGIFPGESGEGLIGFYAACRKPIVTTLHTIIPRCSDLPRRIVRAIVRTSRATVVMAEVAVDLLRSDYAVPLDSVRVIPHGVPPFRRMGRYAAKNSLGFRSGKLISTFGLLSRGKGLEYMIAAMPQVVDRHPDAVYCILGRTHPLVKKHEQESYREELEQMVAERGLEQNVHFADRFLADEELSVFLEATDVFVTPYLGADQITSGALARAAFFGKAIVSTPFLYATELLGNRRGRFAPFKNSDLLGREVAAVLSDDHLRAAMETRMEEYGRRMAWQSVARQYATVFTHAAFSQRKLVAAAGAGIAPRLRRSQSQPKSVVTRTQGVEPSL